MPEGVERSSGSRVRLPVRTTRLMLVAAMSADSLQNLLSDLPASLRAASEGFGAKRRFLRRNVAELSQSVGGPARIGPPGRVRYPFGPAPSPAPDFHARARRASQRDAR